MSEPTTWKPVILPSGESWEGYYSVNLSTQEVRRDREGRGSRVGYVLSPWKGGGGYLQITLSRGKYRSAPRLHGIICVAAHGLPEPGQQVRHLDGNKLNNRPDNLRWGTGSENHSDRILHGTDNKGERHSCRKLTEDEVRVLRQERTNGSPVRELAQKYGISESQVSAIVNRKSWKHI